MITKDVIPMIDSTFRTIADRDHRAMAGLSMGANQALRLTTHNLDMFTYIGGFSGTMNGLSTDPLDPATAFDGIFKDGAAFNEKVKLLWLGMGTKEPNPFPAAIGAFRTMLDKAGHQIRVFLVARNSARMAYVAKGPERLRTEAFQIEHHTCSHQARLSATLSLAFLMCDQRCATTLVEYIAASG